MPYISNRAELEQRFIDLMNKLRAELDPGDPKNAIYQYFASRAKKNKESKKGLTVQGRMSLTIQTLQHNMRDNLLRVKFSADASSGDIRSYALICNKLGIALDNRILDAMKDPEGDVYRVIKELTGLDADRRTVKFVTLAILNGAGDMGVLKYCMSAGCCMTYSEACASRRLIYNLLHAEEYNSWIDKNVRISGSTMSFTHPLLGTEFKNEQKDKPMMYQAFNYIIAQVTSRINEYVLQSCMDDCAVGSCVIGEIHDAVEFLDGCSKDQILRCVSDGLDNFCSDYGCDRSLLRYEVEQSTGSVFEWVSLWQNGYRYKAYIGDDDRKKVRVGLVAHGTSIIRVQEYSGSMYDKYRLERWMDGGSDEKLLEKVRSYCFKPDRDDAWVVESMDDIGHIYNEQVYADRTARLSNRQFMTDIGYKIREFISANRHSIIIGNTGTGKSTFIRDMVSKDESVRVFVLRNNNKLNHLDGEGESYAQNIDSWKTIRSVDDAAIYEGCTVVIDEAHMLFSDHAYRSCVEGLGWILRREGVSVVFVSATFTDAMLSYMKVSWGCRVFSITKDTEKKVYRRIVPLEDHFAEWMIREAQTDRYDAVLLHTDCLSKKLMTDIGLQYDHWICRESYDMGFCVEACSKEYMFEGVYIGTQYAEQGIDGRLGGSRRALIISNVSGEDELDLCRMVQVEGRFRNAVHIDHIILFNGCSDLENLDICDINTRKITDLEQVDILCINQFRALITSVSSGMAVEHYESKRKKVREEAVPLVAARMLSRGDSSFRPEGCTYMHCENPNVLSADMSKKTSVIASTVFNMDISDDKKCALLWNYKALAECYDYLAEHNRSSIAEELGVQSIFTVKVDPVRDVQTDEIIDYYAAVTPIVPAAYRFLESMSGSQYIRWVEVLKNRAVEIYKFKKEKGDIKRKVKSIAYSRRQILDVIASMEKVFGCERSNVYNEHYVIEDNPFENDKQFREEYPETLSELRYEIPVDDVWWDFKGYKEAGWRDGDMQIMSKSGIFSWYSIHCAVMAVLYMMDRVEPMPFIRDGECAVEINGEQAVVPVANKKRDQKGRAVGKAVGKAVHVQYKDTLTGTLYGSMEDAIAAIAPDLVGLKGARQRFSKKYACRVVKVRI